MTRPSAPAMTGGLQRRLLVMLISPLILLAFLNAWFDYRSADNVALQQDQRLVALVPLLADSVIGDEARPGGGLLMLMAPPIEEFLKVGPGFAAFSIVDPDGRTLSGEKWLSALPPTTFEPEFHSEENQGTTWRIVRQRVQSVAGEITVALADGTDPRQQWSRAILFKVLLPNLVLITLAAFAVNWAVHRALKPLLDLKEAVERRSPRDLSAIDEQASPEEVRPLVLSLNRLFSLVNVQAEGQRRFVADAAHQLRTPLAGLQAQVEAWALMARAAAQPAAADTEYKPNQPLAKQTRAPAAITLGVDEIEKLRAATRRTSQLAHQLLALSRADARSLQAQSPERVDLQDLCEILLEQFLDAATAKSIDLGLEAAPAHVSGHGWLLRELLSNLIDNAIQYTPPGASVTIRCGQQGEGTGPVFLQVEDNGPGVPVAEQTQVLQRFYRLPSSGGEGTGLGLAIADEIARAHGAVLVLGSPDQGSGLRVTVVFVDNVIG